MTTWDEALLISDRTVQAVFGEVAEYRSALDVSTPLPHAIFSNEYSSIDGGEANVPTSLPALWVRLEDLPIDPVEDDGEVTAAGFIFRIVDVKPDGEGGAWLVLQKIGPAS